LATKNNKDDNVEGDNNLENNEIKELIIAKYKAIPFPN